MNIMDCIFCRIISGELPAAVVHRNPRTVSFLDINPMGRGHCLVVPTAHHQSLHDLPVEHAGEVLATISRVASAIVRALGATGFNVMLNNGASAGQIVPHLHFHILPRYDGDGISFKVLQRHADPGELEDVRRVIVEQIRRDGF